MEAQVRIDTNRYTAILTDFDGTVLDNEPLYYEVTRQALAAVGINFLPLAESYEKYSGTGLRHIFDEQLRLHNIEADAGQMVEIAHSHYLRLIEEQGLKATDGVREFLTESKKAGLKLAMVSGGARENILRGMKVAAIPDVYDAIISREDYLNPKPDPECFRTAAKRLGVDAGKCLVFEDSLNGLRGAELAGMDRIAVRSVAPESVYERFDNELSVITSFKQVTFLPVA